MRVLGLDIGERRVGVAVSDPDGRIASPLQVLDAQTLSNPASLLALIDEYDVGLLVVGLPLSLDGTEGPQAARVKEQAQRLARTLPVGVVYYDERLSSAEARRSLSATGMSARVQRGKIDMVAAALILQSYLDAQRAFRPDGAADE
ncbi:MAG: Holliday junction resolvase RuvX [Actinomycetota bacterium]|nr:Holliday junction resolvase RuvX [Actinomycetota bacterium]